MNDRVALTPAAAELLDELWQQNGPLMFHQSGGCCDGSAPMCFPEGEFITSEADVRLGDLALDDDRTVPVWMSAEQFGYWRHTHLTIDVVPGRGSGFSLESPTGKRFLIRSRLYEGGTDDPGPVAERVAPVPPPGPGSALPPGTPGGGPTG